MLYSLKGRENELLEKKFEEREGLISDIISGVKWSDIVNYFKNNELDLNMNDKLKIVSNDYSIETEFAYTHHTMSEFLEEIANDKFFSNLRNNSICLFVLDDKNNPGSKLIYLSSDFDISLDYFIVNPEECYFDAHSYGIRTTNMLIDNIENGGSENDILRDAYNQFSESELLTEDEFKTLESNLDYIFKIDDIKQTTQSYFSQEIGTSFGLPEM